MKILFFLESELEQVKRRILLLRNISDVRHLRQSTKYIEKFISPNCIVKIIKSQLYIPINEIKQNYKQIYQRQRHIVELTTTQNIQEQNLIERCKHRHKTA